MIKLYFNQNYFKLTLALFALEFVIAMFIHDSIMRPFGGDALVVILIYCFLKIFLNGNPIKIATGVLLFAFVVEFLQYVDYAKLLGFDSSPVLSILLGRTFSWMDLVAYFTGYVVIILCER